MAGPSTSNTVVATYISSASKTSSNTAVLNQAPASLLPPTTSPSFTQSQFALALALQKSKPEGISTKEYHQLLKSNIKVGIGFPATSHRYVDTAEFWKGQFTRLFEENKILKSKLLCADQRLVQEGVNNDELSTDQISARSRKRPAHSHDVDTWLEDQPGDDVTPNQNMLLLLSSYVLRISRYRKTLETAAKDFSQSDHIEVLFKSSIDILALIDIALSDCCIPFWSLRSNDDAQILSLLRQLMHQIVLGFKSCFTTLQDLCRTILGRSKRFEIVYRLITFFDKSLDHLRTLCNIQTESEMEDSRRLRHKRVRTESEYAVNKYITSMLISISQMEWKDDQLVHKEILEGVLFIILNRTGKLLSNAVFQEHVASSDRPGNIKQSGEAFSPEAAKLETRYLIPILHAALGVDCARKELVVRVLAENGTHTGLQGGDILLKARKLIQSSLVKSAVGGEDLQGLKMPSLPADEEGRYVPEIGTEVELYGPEWLLESVWALIGWDLAVQ